jgi:hypothetical protein
MLRKMNPRTVSGEHHPHWELRPLHLPVRPIQVHHSHGLQPRPEVFGIAQDTVLRYDRRWGRWYAIVWASVWQDAEAFHPPLVTTRPCEYQGPAILSSALCIASASSERGERRLEPIG